jgi:hypothetical protein
LNGSELTRTAADAKRWAAIIKYQGKKCHTKLKPLAWMEQIAIL